MTPGAADAGTIQRCWADATSCLVIDRPIECQALGTEPLGLCPRHFEEILGTPVPVPIP